MATNNTLYFFYQKTSARIGEQYEIANRPKYISILEKNPKLLSFILNCKTTIKNNPYLITDSAMSAILKSNSFTFLDESEILWGKEDEILSYVKDLFILLWKEYIPLYNIIDSEYYMSDYLPYAKHAVTKKAIINEKNEFAEALFNTSREEILSKDEVIVTKALEYLFIINQDWFVQEWLRFTRETISYTKLNKLIDSFVSTTFIPNLLKNRPSEKSSLGIRVKNLLESDLSVKDLEIRVFGYQNTEEKVKGELFKASLTYVNQLEKIFRFQNDQP